MPAGRPLPDKIRKKLESLVETRGPRGACELLDLPVQTLARAAAGWGIRAGTELQITQALGRLHEHGASGE